MSGTMNALVAHAPYDYRFQTMPIPLLQPGEILLKVKGCGICAGDIKAFHGGLRIWGTSPENRYIEAPVIGGHEFCGEVVQLGPGVEEFQIGDFLVSEQIVPCGECAFCRQGRYWLCARSAVFGFKQYCQGGFAEFIKLDKNCINHKLPSCFTVEQAVLVEPIACGMHAVERACIQHHQVVVIAGLGAIGLSMVNLAKLQLPKMVIGIDLKEKRLALGKEFGADVVLNPAQCNVVDEIHRLTNGLGCDVYIEASGSEKSVRQGLDALTNGGKFVQMGVFAEEVTADWNIIGDGKELNILGSHLSALTFPAVIQGIANGSIKTEGLLSSSYPLENWKDAFHACENDPDAIKIMLVP